MKYLIGFIIGLILTIGYYTILYKDAQNMSNFLANCKHQMKNKDFLYNIFIFDYRENLTVILRCDKRK